jgi:O-antigen/teichoic acid export membrane protein
VVLSNEAHAASRGALVLIVLQSVARLAILGFVVVAAHAVPADQFGRYSTVAAVFVLVGFISDFGTTSATTKWVSAGADTNRLLINSLSMCAVLGLLAWSVGTAALLAAGYPGFVVGDFMFLGAALPFDACTSTIVGAMDGSGKTAQRAWISLARVGGGAVLAGAAIVATGSIRAALIGLTAGSVLAFVTAVVIARRSGLWTGRIRINPRHGWALILAALPFAAISSLSVVSSRFDVVLLSAITSRATTASYDLALRAVESPLFLVSLLTGPTLFLFTRRLAAGDTDGVRRAFERTARVLGLVSLPLSALALTLAGPLIRTAFGTGYEAAIVPMAILGGQLFLMFMTGLQGMLLTALPKMRPAVILLVLLNIAGVAIQATFIALFGLLGAAAAIPVCQLLAIGTQAGLLRRRMGFWAVGAPPLRVWIAAAACAITAHFLEPTGLVVAVAAGGVAYAVVLVITRAVTTADITFIRAMARRTA